MPGNEATNSTNLRRTEGGSIVQSALKNCQSAFWGVCFFSCIINVLMLVGPLFMMQVYDRVLTSGSVPTLIALLLLVTLLYMFYGVFDLLRSRVLIRVGQFLELWLSPFVFQTVVLQPLHPRKRDQSTAPIRDMDTIRQFLSGSGPLAFFDMPWTPLYLAIIYMFHPILGFIASAGAVCLFILAILSETTSRKLMAEAATLGAQRGEMASNARGNAETTKAMGMNPHLGRIWSKIDGTFLDVQSRASNRAALLSSFTRSLRLFMQSAILAAGAWLAIKQEVTPGTIIAGSIVMSRALAPIELAVGNWRSFVAARQSIQRLKSTLNAFSPVPKTDLCAPTETLTLKEVTVSPPGSTVISVERVTFKLRAGDGLGIVGPSASGKSSLVRAITGVWPTLMGEIRIDGAALDQWDPNKLGSHIGYLPQSVDLFRGTVTENIARFEPIECSKSVIEAAQRAGIHEMILCLPNGYDTEIGEKGSVLSAGQRQRIGLARALYNNPFLIVLDEPNSNLDPDGEAALSHAIAEMRTNGSIVIVVAHRPSALDAVNHILVLNNGKQQAFEVRGQIQQSEAVPKFSVANDKPRKSGGINGETS